MLLIRYSLICRHLLDQLPSFRAEGSEGQRSDFPKVAKHVVHSTLSKCWLCARQCARCWGQGGPDFPSQSLCSSERLRKQANKSLTVLEIRSAVKVIKRRHGEE